MRRRTWAAARAASPPVMLAILVWRLGTGPFLEGLRTIDATALGAAAGLMVLTTVCSAWRWKLVARALGIELSIGAAVAAYYRALLLNVTLPGGVVGDIHRGLRHGRDVRDVNRALRSVVWERFAGQIVQVLLTVAALLALPSPVRSAMPLAALAVGAALIGLARLACTRRSRSDGAWARLTRGAAGDIREGLLARTVWPGVALASAMAISGHAITFLIAARTAGVSAPVSQMLPIALLVMAAMVLPSVGGWGPREGAAAWAFGAAGLGAQHGVATAVVYGVMVLVGSLPGAAVLAMPWLRGARRSRPGKLRLGKRAVHA